MKITWLIFGVLGSITISSLAQVDIDLKLRPVTFTNLQGRVYENVRLSRANNDGVAYFTDGGGGMVLYTNLAPVLLAAWSIPTNSGSLYLERIEAKRRDKIKAELGRIKAELEWKQKVVGSDEFFDLAQKQLGASDNPSKTADQIIETIHSYFHEQIESAISGGASAQQINDIRIMRDKTKLKVLDMGLIVAQKQADEAAKAEKTAQKNLDDFHANPIGYLKKSNSGAIATNSTSR
jgi:virulence-associated protein VapD